MNTALYFTPDGTGRALYNETVNLAAIGRLNISRATRIEFDDREQLWQVHPPRSRKVLFANSSREACLAWEQAYLEEQEDAKHSSTLKDMSPEALRIRLHEVLIERFGIGLADVGEDTVERLLRAEHTPEACTDWLESHYGLERID